MEWGLKNLGTVNSATERTVVPVTAAKRARDVTFVFRAPLQWTQLPPGDQTYQVPGGAKALPYGGDPAVRFLAVSGTGGSAAGRLALGRAVVSQVQVVELDGLSTGWMDEDESDPLFNPA